VGKAHAIQGRHEKEHWDGPKAADNRCRTGPDICAAAAMDEQGFCDAIFNELGVTYDKDHCCRLLQRLRSKVAA